MSSLERWDIIIRFIDGPLGMRGDITLLGPTVHVGANPGPDGLKLEGYRGLDDRQAVFTAYDGASVSVAPIGNLQVRVAPDEHVQWADAQPIRGPVYLSPGDAIHFGPPGRGGTCIFVRAQRVGEWQQRALVSDAAQVGSSNPKKPSAATQVKKVDTGRGIPWWLIPSMLGIFGAFAMTMLLGIFVYYRTQAEPIGPVVEGEESYDLREQLDEMLTAETSKDVKIDSSAYKGVEAGFEIFVMAPNAEAADWKELKTDQKLWDKSLLDWVKRSVTIHAMGWRFWQRLDAVVNDYAYVLEQMRIAGLPDVMAAIPYQESNYKGDIKANLVCALGWWQFLPEIANQAEIPIKNCQILGQTEPWNPGKSPPIGVLKHAVYINKASTNYGCLIKSCEVDQRPDLSASTKGAARLLGKAYADPNFRASGAAVQMVIASHNAGYDNSPYLEGNQKNHVNMRWAYEDWRNKTKKTSPRTPNFFGENITCTTADSSEGYNPNRRCDGVLGIETQHYVHLIIAQHLLAACYYGRNYPDVPAFKAYAELVVGEGYCRSFKIPERDEVQKHK